MYRFFAVVAMTGLMSATAMAQTMIEAGAELLPSGVPASDDNPPCGDPQVEKVKANMVSNALGSAADRFIGYPILSTALQSLDQDTRNTINQWLGQNHGKSSCQTICAAAPPNVQAKFQSCINHFTESGQFSGLECSAITSDAAQAVIDDNFGKTTNGSADNNGKALIFCVTGKNWSHDQRRSAYARIHY